MEQVVEKRKKLSDTSSANHQMLLACMTCARIQRPGAAFTVSYNETLSAVLKPDEIVLRIRYSNPSDIACLAQNTLYLTQTCLLASVLRARLLLKYPLVLRRPSGSETASSQHLCVLSF